MLRKITELRVFTIFGQISSKTWTHFQAALTLTTFLASPRAIHVVSITHRVIHIFQDLILKIYTSVMNRL